MRNRARTPQDFAALAEAHPRLPAGAEERVSGYGVMSVPFDSGHVLGLRRWTASSVGVPFTSIWHRSPDGTWRFLETMVSEEAGTIACSRWFGRGTKESVKSDLSLDWPTPQTLHIASESIDWTVTIDSSPMTQMMNTMMSAMPGKAWKSPTVLKMMGGLASRTLGSGDLRLVGTTSNGYSFIANPWRIWRVVESHATVDGRDIGRPAALPQQTALADFLMPQRGIFAMGRMYMTRPEEATTAG